MTRGAAGGQGVGDDTRGPIQRPGAQARSPALGAQCMLNVVALGLLLHLATSDAQARDVESEPREVAFSGRAIEVDVVRTAPFGRSVDQIVGEFWIEVTVQARGDVTSTLDGDATSAVGWSTTDGVPGGVIHTLTPVPASGRFAVAADIDLVVSLDVWEGNYGSGSRLVSFPVIGEVPLTTVEATPFTPFLAPDADPATATASTPPSGASFTATMGIPLGLSGIAELTSPATLSGRLEIAATVSDGSLSTALDGASVDGSGRAVLARPTDAVDVASRWRADAALDVALVLASDVRLVVEVLGLLTTTIDLPLAGVRLPLVSRTREVVANGEAEHPMPRLVAHEVGLDAGNVGLGDEVTVVYEVENLGDLDAVLNPFLDGDDGFSVPPDEVVVPAGGTTSIPVTFAPTRMGVETATLVLDSSDPFLETWEVAVRGTGVDGPGPVASLRLPDPVVVDAGGVLVVPLEAEDASGRPVQPGDVTWQLDPAAGSIASDGTLTAARTAGWYPLALSASAGGVTLAADVRVLPLPTSAVNVEPAALTLRRGEPRTIVARAVDPYGNATGDALTWWADPRAGTVTIDGRFRAGDTPGSFPGAVRASVGGIAGAVDVTVVDATLDSVRVDPEAAVVRSGGTVFFRAEVRDSAGAVVPDSEVVWSASPAAGTIDATGRFVAAEAPGRHENAVTAVVDRLTDSAAVEIRAEDATDDGAANRGCGCAQASVTALGPVLLGLAGGIRRRRTPARVGTARP